MSLCIACSQLKESLAGVATSSAAALHLSLPLLELLLDVEAVVGAAVVSSQAVSEPLKQAEQEQEEQEGATGPTKRAASQPATSPLPARPAQVSQIA